MGRLVKCKDNGQRLDSDSIFKTVRTTDSGRTVTEFWSSEEAYKLYRSNCEYKNKINDKMKELLEYKSNLPSTFYIGLEEFKPYGFKTVYEYICYNSESFVYANAYWKDSQPKLMKYLLGIIRNGIHPFYMKKTEYEKAAKKQSEPVSGEIEAENRKQSAKDISKFLEE